MFERARSALKRIRHDLRRGRYLARNLVAHLPMVGPASPISVVANEIIDRRTRNSKTRQLTARRFAWDGSIGAIHYDNQGTWESIDAEFVPAASPWDWEMTRAGYQIRVKEDLTTGQVLGFSKAGESVTIQPMALQWTNDLDQIQPISMPQDEAAVIANPVIDLLSAVGMPSHTGTIRWNNAYGAGIDLQWQCRPTRLAKILEIDQLASLPVPQQYIRDGGNPVLRLSFIFDPSSNVAIFVDGEEWNQSTTVQTANIIEFRKDGEVLWGFVPLRYWGSDDDPVTNTGQSIATLTKRGSSLYVSIRVPYEWLQAAVFPVFLDTDVDEQVGASTDDATVFAGVIYLEYAHFAAGKHGNGNAYKAGARFQTVGISKGATVSVAYLNLKSSANESETACNTNLFAEDADDADTFSTLGDFEGRSRTAAVPWDGIAGWINNQEYQSLSLVTPVTTVISRAGWNSGQDMAFFWEDDNSDNGARRFADAWDNGDQAPQFHAEFEEAAAAASGVNPIAALLDGQI